MPRRKNPDSPTGWDEEDMTTETEGDPTPSTPPDDLAARMRALEEKWQVLRGDPGAAGERSAVAREMRALRDVMVARQPTVEITIPTLPDRKPIRLGPKVFGPGRHRVKESEASYLLWIVDQAQRQERARMTGRNWPEMDASDMTSRVRAILAED